MRADGGYVETVLTWLRQADSTPVPFEVPGTSTVERVRLAALGGLVAATVVHLNLEAQLSAIEEHVPLKEWISARVTVPTGVVEAMAMCVRESPEESLAAIYSGAVSSANRRRLGTFFTPSAEVEQMLAGCERVGLEPQTVFDVGAGVGIFTAAAHRKWATADVLAVDINPVTLGLLGLLAASQGALAGPDGSGIRLVQADFVDVVREGFTSTTGPRLILGNPPYTRMQLLPRMERARLVEAAHPLCGSRASLSTIITAISLKHLAPEDGMALLLPAQWLESDYARPLREKIWSQSRRAVELHMFRADLFSEAQVDAVSLLVGPSQATMAPLTTSNEADETPVSHDRGQPTPATWRSLFRGPKARVTNRRHTSSSVRLEDFARIKRGVATGANWFFVLTEEGRREHRLPATVLQPMLRRLRDHPGTELTSAALIALPMRDKRWLFVCPPRSNRNEEATKYIALGEAMGVDKGVLCSERLNWYDLSQEVHIPDVIVGPSTKGEFRFMDNVAGSPITNNLYGMSWHSFVSAETKTALLDWLRSPSGQRQISNVARSQGSGLLKVEPRALCRLQLPARFTAEAAIQA